MCSSDLTIYVVLDRFADFDTWVDGCVLIPTFGLSANRGNLADRLRSLLFVIFVFTLGLADVMVKMTSVLLEVRSR